MSSVYSRFDVGEFCTWHECQGCQPRIPPGEHDAARDWLRGFLVDDAQVARLRQLGHLSVGDAGLSLQGSHSVIEQLAGQIASGQLRVCGKYHPVHQIETSAGTAAAGLPPAPAPVAAPRSASAVTAAAPDPATLPSTTDAKAMASVLVAAAAQGLPFCEVCEKKKAARQAEEAAA